MEDTVDNKKNAKAEKRYSKNQLLNSKKYFDKKDLLNVLLTDNNLYSFKEVDTVVDSFLRKMVR